MDTRACEICKIDTNEGIVCQNCWTTKGYEYCYPYVSDAFEKSRKFMKQLNIPFNEYSVSIIDLYDILNNPITTKKLITMLNNKAFL